MADIIITNDDLKDPSIDDMINLQRSAMPQGSDKVEDIKTPFYFNPIFYYCLATMLGALAVWGADRTVSTPIRKTAAPGIPIISSYLLFRSCRGHVEHGHWARVRSGKSELETGVVLRR